MSDTIKKHTRLNPWIKAANAILFSLLGLVVLVVIALFGATMYLTPERLSNIINTQSSKYLDADVRVSNARFTLWSSFPRLQLEFDSVSIVSRSLRSLPSDTRARLPQYADSLLSTGHLRAGINLADLLHKDITLLPVAVDSTRLNIVQVSDSIANFNIVKPGGKPMQINSFSLASVKLDKSADIRFFSLPQKMEAKADLDSLSVSVAGAAANTYSLRTSGRANLTSAGTDLLRNLPFSLAGPVTISTSPLRVALSNFDYSLAQAGGKINIGMHSDTQAVIDSLRLSAADANLLSILDYLPTISLPVKFRKSDVVKINAVATLESPYTLSKTSGELPAIRLDIPELQLNAYGADMRLKAAVLNLLTAPDVMLTLSGNADVARLSHLVAELRPYALNGKINADASAQFSIPDISKPQPKNLTFKGNLALQNYSVNIPQDTLKASGRNLDIAFNGNSRQVEANIKGSGVKVAESTTKVSLNTFSSNFKAASVNKKIKTADFAAPAAWNADRRSLRNISHTPELLHVNLPKNIADIMRNWQTSLSVKVDHGSILTPVLPLHNDFDNLDLSASFDSVNLRNLHFNSQDTRMRVKGNVSNLRQFLLSRTAAPLCVALDVAIDTVQINQLCGAFNRGIALTHGPRASILTVIPDTLTPSDTITLLIPRNIRADIHASAMMTKYTNLELHNLNANLAVSDGNLRVSDLGVDSDFGALRLNFGMNTADIQRLAMNMQLSVADVELVNFFSNFHTLLLMMPQMRNLKGDLSAMAEARLMLFPDMYLNIPSLWADLYVHGDHLTVHQDPFIRHITKMMLIHNGSDLKIDDLNVHASIHDNLMELYPFDISFDRYRLNFAGINNFAGDMYYHVGIDKSPIPIPFGINIKGDFKHPTIRFGGPSFKVSEGQKISSAVQEDMRINLMLQSKLLIREMIEKAAEADTTPASFFTY